MDALRVRWPRLPALQHGMHSARKAAANLHEPRVGCQGVAKEMPVTPAEVTCRF